MVEYGAELMLTPVRKSLRLNQTVEDVKKEDVCDMLVTGTAVYLPEVHTV